MHESHWWDDEVDKGNLYYYYYTGIFLTVTGSISFSNIFYLLNQSKIIYIALYNTRKTKVRHRNKKIR